MSEYPFVDKDNCIGCQACQGACPNGETLWEFDADGKSTFKIDNKDECIGCHACEGTCPNGAISFKEY